MGCGCGNGAGSYTAPTTSTTIYRWVKPDGTTQDFSSSTEAYGQVSANGGHVEVITQ